MLYQRTGPEGTLGLWLLLSSRVALLSVNIRYIVSWYTPAGVSPKGTVWGSGQGQWEGIYSLASKAISHHSLWLCLLQHLWESPLHCISLSGILQACPLTKALYGGWKPSISHPSSLGWWCGMLYMHLHPRDTDGYVGGRCWSGPPHLCSGLRPRQACLGGESRLPL